MQYILMALKLNIFQKKFKKFIGNKNVITNVLYNRIEAFNLIICEYILDLLILCKKAKVYCITQVYSLLMIMTRMIK